METNSSQSIEGAKPSFTHEALHQALMNVEDLMTRLVITDWFLHLRTAENVKNNLLLDGDGIDVLVRDKVFTQYVYDILNTYWKYKPEDVNKGFEYKVGDVPVRIHVYTKEYEFLKYPDHVVYLYGTYQLGNPFKEYWEKREEIE